jgi:hypothetical protein
MNALTQLNNFVTTIINPQTWVFAGVAVLLLLLIFLYSIDRVVQTMKDVREEIRISNALLRTIEVNISQKNSTLPEAKTS